MEIVPPRSWEKPRELTASEVWRLYQRTGPRCIDLERLDLMQEFPYLRASALALYSKPSAKVWQNLAREELVPFYRFGAFVYFDPIEVQAHLDRNIKSLQAIGRIDQNL